MVKKKATSQPRKPVPKHRLPDPVAAPAPPPPAISKWWPIGASAAFAVLAVCVIFALGGDLRSWEHAVLRVVNGWPDSWRTIGLVLSIVPESLWIGVASVAATFVLKMYQVVWRLAASIITGYAIAQGLRLWVERARPAELTGDIHARVDQAGMGFPSGHALVTTIVVLTLLPYMPRWARAPLIACIPVMALSRLYLGVHAPLDLIAGVAIGVIVVAMPYLLPAKLRKLLRFA